MAQRVILHTEELHRHFGGVLATNAVNIEFNENRLKSIIGPNGAGKTTLINVITRALARQFRCHPVPGTEHHRPAGP